MPNVALSKKSQVSKDSQVAVVAGGLKNFEDSVQGVCNTEVTSTWPGRSATMYRRGKVVDCGMARTFVAALKDDDDAEKPRPNAPSLDRQKSCSHPSSDLHSYSAQRLQVPEYSFWPSEESLLSPLSICRYSGPSAYRTSRLPLLAATWGMVLVFLIANQHSTSYHSIHSRRPKSYHSFISAASATSD